MVADETFKLRLEGNSVRSGLLSKVAPIYVHMDFLRSTGIFPNDPGKGEGADATELLIRQPGLPAKIHPDGSQEDWHEIYRNREADHPGIAKSQGVCGIDSAFLHVSSVRNIWGGPLPKRSPHREIPRVAKRSVETRLRKYDLDPHPKGAP